jgi:hypothetical protein
VAQHSQLVARAVLDEWGSPTEAMYGLLHDASEAYLGDMVRPLKLTMPAYKVIEEVTMRVILAGLRVPAPDELCLERVKQVDDALLMTERRDLITGKHEWSCRAAPLPARIYACPPEKAAHEFRKLYATLLAGGARRVAD